MKFIKAVNQGIVTDLGLGKHVYNITTEGCEVEDSVAVKIKEVFGHLIEVTEGTEPAPETVVAPAFVPAAIITEVAAQPINTEVAPESVPEVAATEPVQEEVA